MEAKRMKKLLAGGILAVTLLGAVILLGLGTKAEGEIDKGPESITIEVIKKIQTPVVFPHRKHQEIVKDKCVECHHTLKEGEQAGSCTSCHNKEGAKVSLKDAFHKQCQDCHKKESAAGKKAPTKCNECHKK